MKITLIGAGNVATNLGHAIQGSKHDVVQVISKSMSSAKELGTILNCNYSNKLSEINNESDIYIISTNDDHIRDIIKNINISSGIFVHTAGSVDMSIFQNKFEKYGVMYPLQTFSKSKIIDLQTVPFCLEASDKSSYKEIEGFTKAISTNIYQINSTDRKSLHIAAVFINNFTNHMYHIGEELLNSKDLDIDILRPLIEETANKTQKITPSKAQTGPAIRNDQTIIKEHLDLLKEFPDFKKMYSFVSESIQNLNKKKNENG